MDIDQLSRALKDLEYRVKLLEKAILFSRAGYAATQNVVNFPDVSMVKQTWCECGREHCRKPDCPSHKSDPMGR